MISKILSGILLTALFVGSVAAAGATVGSSYQSAQLEQRLVEAESRRQVLQERLARAQALQLVVGYAQAQGYIETGAQTTIQMTASLAQR